MSLENTNDAADLEVEPAEIYDEDGFFRSDFLEKIELLLEEGAHKALQELVEPLHGSELGDLLEALDSASRIKLVEIVGAQFDIASLTEVDDAVRFEIVEAMPNDQVADAVRDIDSDDAVYILEDLESDEQAEILSKIPIQDRMRILRSLEYPEETAGRRMQTELVAVPEFWSVGQTIDYMREEENLPDRFHEIFVVGPAFELLGSVALDRILRTNRKKKVFDIMGDTIYPIDANLDQEEAARLFERYDLISAAVIDASNRLVGVLTIDDVVDVIHQEADEDIKALGGVGDEELSDSVASITRSRFSWLFVNLLTAVFASLVIGLFDATIDQMVALAILMPIVASMGGNAGTQTMTVVVRALATRDMDTTNFSRVFRREFFVGLLNGLLFAVLIGLVASVWFSNVQLGAVIAIAMIFNMVCAAVSGISIPVILNKFDVDPAISSSVFVTTVTDVVGFFAFLGLASIWLL